MGPRCFNSREDAFTSWCALSSLAPIKMFSISASRLKGSTEYNYVVREPPSMEASLEMFTDIIEVFQISPSVKINLHILYKPGATVPYQHQRHWDGNNRYDIWILFSISLFFLKRRKRGGWDVGLGFRIQRWETKGEQVVRRARYIYGMWMGLAWIRNKGGGIDLIRQIPQHVTLFVYHGSGGVLGCANIPSVFRSSGKSDLIRTNWWQQETNQEAKQTVGFHSYSCRSVERMLDTLSFEAFVWTEQHKQHDYFNTALQTWRSTDPLYISTPTCGWSAQTHTNCRLCGANSHKV